MSTVSLNLKEDKVAEYKRTLANGTIPSGFSEEDTLKELYHQTWRTNQLLTKILNILDEKNQKKVCNIVNHFIEDD